MKFSKLAQLFSELESTTKRLEMIDILSKFFKEIIENKNYDDLDKIIYLLKGQLISNIKQFPKMGIAEKMKNHQHWMQENAIACHCILISDNLHNTTEP